MSRGNGERVSRCIDRSPQANNTTIPKVVRVDHRRVVHLIVSNAFDVRRTAEGRVDRYGVTTSRAARIGEGPCFVVVRSRETAARARLPGAGARLAVPANTIRLSRITRRESVGRDGTEWTLIHSRR